MKPKSEPVGASLSAQTPPTESSRQQQVDAVVEILRDPHLFNGGFLERAAERIIAALSGAAQPEVSPTPPDGGSDKVKSCLRFIRQCVSGRCNELDLEVIRGEIDGALGVADGNSESLRRALKSLYNEVHGALGIAEPEIRAAIGNTNMACIERRLSEAKSALGGAAPEGDCPCGATVVRKSDSANKSKLCADCAAQEEAPRASLSKPDECQWCHASPCTCPHGWPEAQSAQLNISEADLRGVFGHKCDQANCPVCHPDMTLTEMAELYERAATPHDAPKVEEEAPSPATDAQREKLTTVNSRELYIRAKLYTLVPSQIRAVRLKRGLSQKQLADLCGMKQARISEMETAGACNYTIATLARIAAAMGIALQIEFCTFAEMLNWENSYSQDSFDVTPIASGVVAEEEAGAPTQENEPKCCFKDPSSPRVCDRELGHSGNHDDSTMPMGAIRRDEKLSVKSEWRGVDLWWEIDGEWISDRDLRTWIHVNMRDSIWAHVDVIRQVQIDAYRAAKFRPCTKCGKSIYRHGDSWYHTFGADVMNCGEAIPAGAPEPQEPK